jgi:potassium-dependent mechanosensitive channel
MGERAQRIAKTLQAIGVAAIFLWAPASGECFGQTPAGSQQSSAPPPSTAIPPAEVATRSSEVANLLISFSEKFAPSPELEKIQQTFQDVRTQINLDFTDTSAILGEQPTLATLQAQQAAWQRRHLQVSTWLTLFTQRAVDLRGTLDRLAQMRETWIQARDTAQAEQAPAAILNEIQATLASIEASQLSWKTREDVLLGLQGDMAWELARCDEMLAQIVKAQKSAVEGILVRENLPVWSSDLWGNVRTVMPLRIRGIARGFWANILEYVREPSRGMPLHAVLFLVMTMAAVAARRKKRQWVASGTGVSSAVKVFDRPYSAALMVTLIAATVVISPAPARVKDVFSVLALAPMIRLVRPVIDPRLIPVAFAAVILYVADFVRQTLGGAPLAGQALLMLESLAAFAVLGWLLQAERLRLAMGHSPESVRARSVPVLAKVLMLCLAAGFLAAVLGYTRLARLITPAVVSGGVLALSLYAYFRVASGTVAITLRAWPLQRLQMVINHCDRIEGWICRVLVWAAAVMWTLRSLDYIGLLNPVLSVGSAILDLKLERGSISISIGDALAFVLTLWAAYLLSAFIRFALQEEVYPRRGIARGLSYAYSRLVHYVILALGFLVGLGVLGMDLTKVSVLAGAFGVGIGFGLQDVVNNFVCGLILLFERPVHVGDIVEVGGLQGEVRRIGIRASTVRTYQGADIIVPNSQFITANVTNWTLSDQLRRIDLPVGVNYGAAPQQVIELLVKTAQAHPAILKDPPSSALFTGYGDSSINFELRAWTDQFGNSALIRSELASAVYNAVYAAGISFPFPQREVRVLKDTKTGSSEAFQPKGGAEPTQKSR